MTRLRGWVAQPEWADRLQAMFPETRFADGEPRFITATVRSGKAGLLGGLGYDEPTTATWVASYLRVAEGHDPPREWRIIRTTADGHTSDIPADRPA